MGREAGLRRQRRARRGRRALRRRPAACSATPTSARAAANLGAPDLTRRSARPARARPTSSRYVANPAEFGNTVMQPYAGLGEENLQKIAAFLDASKGPKDVRSVETSSSASRARPALRTPPGCCDALDGRGLRGRPRRVERGDRGARDRAVRRRDASRATRCSQRFTGGAGGVTVYAVDDYKSPYASGSAKVDAYVICPCSMSTVGTLAAGRDGEPDPPRRVGRAEGGPQARRSCRARRRSR